MVHQFEVYPCSKTGRMKKGFCVFICDAVGLLRTVDGWRKFASRFGLKYYAFRLVGESSFSIVEL